jgi:cobaltochelatase CobS
VIGVPLQPMAAPAAVNAIINVAAHTAANAMRSPAPDAPSVPHIPGEPRRVSAREVFADQPAVAAALPASLMLLHYDSPDAPAIDSLYQFSPALLRRALIAVSLDRPIPVWLAGPKGTGKTEFTRQLAARLGRAFYRVGFNRATEPAEILGDMGLRDGATVWQDGPAAQALRTPGAFLLLDEISYAAQGYLASLNPVLERSGAPVRLPRTGEQLNIAAGVMVFAADNTLGHGDTSGEYTSRSTLSADTLDRFSVKLRFDYLPADDEARLLRAIVQRDSGQMLRAAQAGAIIKVAHVARTKGDAGELQGAPGLRACIAMGLLMACGEAATDAYEATVTLSAPPESHEELRSIFAAHWPAADADVNTPNFAV